MYHEYYQYLKDSLPKIFNLISIYSPSNVSNIKEGTLKSVCNQAVFPIVFHS